MSSSAWHARDAGIADGCRDLQDVIHSEKTYVAANTKAASELQKSGEALRAWGSNDGDDLADVLPKIALLYESLHRAELRYNYFVSTTRLHLKSIRSREEALTQIKGRKRQLQAKIEAMEKRLARMGPENKDLPKVTTSLKELRQEMEVMRYEVLSADAAMGDFKRRTIVEALGLKSGGLMELAEKSVVIAETIRLLLEEIPLDPTTPGQARVAYRNEARTDRLLQEAMYQLDTIQFQPQQDLEALDHQYASPKAQGRPPNAGIGSYQEMLASQQEPGHRGPPPRGEPSPGPPSGHPGHPGHRGQRGGHQLPPGMPENPSLPPEDAALGSQGWSAQPHPQPLDMPPQDMPGGAPGVSGLPTLHEHGTHEDLHEDHFQPPYEEHMDALQREDSPQPFNEAFPYHNEEAPAFPPQAPGFMSYTPPGDSTEHVDRAYFEGVGGTKALQAAAAREGNNLSALGHLDMMRTPAMFTDEDDARPGVSVSASGIPTTRGTPDTAGFPGARGPEASGFPESRLPPEGPGYPEARPPPQAPSYPEGPGLPESRAPEPRWTEPPSYQQAPPHYTQELHPAFEPGPAAAEPQPRAISPAMQAAPALERLPEYAREAERPPVAQPRMAQPRMAQPTVAQPPVAQPPVAQPPVAQPPMAQPPVAQPATAVAPANLSRAEPPLFVPTEDTLPAVRIVDGDAMLAEPVGQVVESREPAPPAPAAGAAPPVHVGAYLPYAQNT